jgi:hypothetical protein
MTVVVRAHNAGSSGAATLRITTVETHTSQDSPSFCSAGCVKSFSTLRDRTHVQTVEQRGGADETMALVTSHDNYRVIAFDRWPGTDSMSFVETPEARTTPCDDYVVNLSCALHAPAACHEPKIREGHRMQSCTISSRMTQSCLVAAVSLLVILQVACTSAVTRSSTPPASDAGVDAEPDVVLPDKPMRCIENVSRDPGAQPSPSIPGVTPGVLWKRSAGCTGLHHEPVLAGGHIAMICTNLLAIFDLEGNQTGALGDFSTIRGGGLTADPDGDFYFGATLLWRVTPTGDQVWKTPLAPSSEETETMASSSQLLLSPDGLLFVHKLQGKLKAIDSTDGSVVWERQVGLGAYGEVLNPYAGGGDTFFRNDRAYTTTGAVSELPRIDGTTVDIGPVAYSGPTGASWNPTEKRFTDRCMLDFCGRKRWNLQQGAFTLIGFQDEWLVGTGVSSCVYAPGGERLRGPAYLEGWPAVLGADGILYTLKCDSKEDEYSLHANSWELKEQWSLDLGSPCTDISPLLDGNGVMYVIRDGMWGVTITAVQTPSPGLAHTAMPTRKNNNRRTGRLSP